MNKEKRLIIDSIIKHQRRIIIVICFYFSIWNWIYFKSNVEYRHLSPLKPGLAPQCSCPSLLSAFQLWPLLGGVSLSWAGLCSQATQPHSARAFFVTRKNNQISKHLYTRQVICKSKIKCWKSGIDIYIHATCHMSMCLMQSVKFFYYFSFWCNIMFENNNSKCPSSD